MLPRRHSEQFYHGTSSLIFVLRGVWFHPLCRKSSASRFSAIIAHLAKSSSPLESSPQALRTGRGHPHGHVLPSQLLFGARHALHYTPPNRPLDLRNVEVRGHITVTNGSGSEGNGVGKGGGGGGSSRSFMSRPLDHRSCVRTSSKKDRAAGGARSGQSSTHFFVLADRNKRIAVIAMRGERRACPGRWWSRHVHPARCRATLRRNNATSTQISGSFARSSLRRRIPLYSPVQDRRLDEKGYRWAVFGAEHYCGPACHA